VKLTPEIKLTVSGLVTVSLSVEVPVGRIGFGPNDLESVYTFRDAAAAFAVGWLLVRALVVFVKRPPTSVLTVIVMLQLPPTAIGVVAPLSLMLVLLTASGLFALSVRLPPQVLVVVAEARLIWPGNVGNTSVNTMAWSVLVVLLFVMVNVISEVPRASTGFVPKDLVNVGWRSTVKVAEAVPPVPPSVEVTFPVVLLYVPVAALRTFAVTMQELPAGIVPPLRDREPPPAAAVTVPPAQVVLPLGVAVFTRFAG